MKLTDGFIREDFDDTLVAWTRTVWKTSIGTSESPAPGSLMNDDKVGNSEL
jgi:hypothetical protein